MEKYGELEALGPSPRVRGALGDRLGEILALGTIPARAGSTAPAQPVPAPARDHPRACGEHAELSLRCGTARGPSPRVRGALSLSWDSSGAGGRFQPLPIGLLRDAERFAGLWTHNGPEPPREVPARAIPGSERARPGPVW